MIMCRCEGEMKKCMMHCKWCPLIPVVLGVVLFLLGYFLDAEIVRIVWLVLSGLVVLMGIGCFIMTSLMMKFGRKREM